MTTGEIGLFSNWAPYEKNYFICFSNCKIFRCTRNRRIMNVIFVARNFLRVKTFSGTLAVFMKKRNPINAPFVEKILHRLPVCNCIQKIFTKNQFMEIPFDQVFVLFFITKNFTLYIFLIF